MTAYYQVKEYPGGKIIFKRLTYEKAVRVRALLLAANPEKDYVISKVTEYRLRLVF